MGPREGPINTKEGNDTLYPLKVTAVGTGEEATALPLEPAPDLLLSDVTLPGIAGSALGERLSERWPSLRVVLMSGYVEETLRTVTKEHGWYLLQKPFEMEVLASQLRTAFEERNLEDAVVNLAIMDRLIA